MKNEKIQVIRALAIFAVILIHTCPMGKWQIIVRPFINFAVATFLFLSGYLTKFGNSNWKKFYKKRISRVLIPYFIWSIIYSIFYRDLDNLFFNLITTKVTGSLYYIYIYIEFVLLTPLIEKLAISKYRNFGWLISPISLIIFKYIWLFSGLKLNYVVSLIWDVCCLGWFNFYYLGILLGNNLINVRYDIKKISLLYVISLLLQIAEGYLWLKLGDINYGSQLKITSIITSLIFLLLVYEYIKNDKIKLCNKVFVIIGDCSFGVYLSHLLVKRFIDNFLFYSYIPYFFNSLLILIISVLCVLVGRKICGKKVSKLLGLL